MIPLNTRFIGIAPQVDLVEKKSSLINAETEPYTMQDIIDTVGNGDGYVKYVALLNQDEEEAPVATVLQNSIGGVPVWTRDDSGSYLCTLASAFPANKTFCLVTYGMDPGSFGVISFGRISNNQLSLVLNGSEGPVDFENAPSNNICVEIRVYP